MNQPIQTLIKKETEHCEEMTQSEVGGQGLSNVEFIDCGSSIEETFILHPLKCEPENDNELADSDESVQMKPDNVRKPEMVLRSVKNGRNLMSKKMMRKQSKLWLHFNQKEGARGECKYCKAVISISGGSTGNLTRHMKKKHPTVSVHRTSRSRSPSYDLNYTPALSISTYGSILQLPSDVSPTTKVNETSPTSSENVSLMATPSELPVHLPFMNEITQPSIESFVQVVQPVPLNKTKIADLQLLKMVCKEYQPFSLVENSEFKNFVHLLNPGYNLPSRKTLSKTLLPQYYDSLVDEIKSKLISATAVSITTDGWTSMNNQRFLAITVHYIESDCLVSNVLGCIEFNETHTATNLASSLKEECIKWGIDQKITAAVTDNAPNIVSAVECNNWKHIPCMAHSLNLIVKASLKPIEPILEQVKVMVQFFRSSNALTKLHQIQKEMGLPEQKLKQDVPTRWNSSYDMIQRVFQNKAPLLSTLAILGYDHLKLSDDEWLVIEQALNALKVFYDVTNEVSSEKTVSLSKSFVLSYNLNNFLNKFLKDNELTLDKTVKEICQILQQETERRLLVSSLDLASEAALLDPRFKQKSFTHCITKYKLSYENVVDLVKELIVSSEINERDVDNSKKHNVETPTKKVSVLWDEFDEAVAREPSLKDPKAMAIVELDKYLAEPLINRCSDPLAWWGQRKFTYPNLYKIILKRLCIPASSVPCERMFSKAGQIMTEKRSLLSPSKLSQIIFLNENL